MTNAVFTVNAALLPRAVVLGGFGGAALLLGYAYSRRGSIMFPIYAAILFVASLVIAQFPGLSFLARFSAVMLAMFIATAISMAGVLHNAARVARKRASK